MPWETRLGQSYTEALHDENSPISFRYLAGDGYPESARKDGTHPVYTMYSFKMIMRNGVKTNGYSADFCMPRYRVSNEELIDLLGYLITLDVQ